MSKVNVHRVSRDGAPSFSERAPSFSETVSNTLEIHDVFGNVPGATAFCTFPARQTSEIHAFLSSTTWNLIVKSINPTILVRSKTKGSTALRGARTICGVASRSRGLLWSSEATKSAPLCGAQRRYTSFAVPQNRESCG